MIPFRGVPARHEDTGKGTFDFGRNPVPRETSFGEGVKGVENGCVVPVEVAAGGPAVRGDGVAVAGKREAFVVDRGRAIEGNVRRADARRRHREQIIVEVVDLLKVHESFEIFFGGSTAAENDIVATNIKAFGHAPEHELRCMKSRMRVGTVMVVQCLVYTADIN